VTKLDSITFKLTLDAMMQNFQSEKFEHFGRFVAFRDNVLPSLSDYKGHLVVARHSLSGGVNEYDFAFVNRDYKKPSGHLILEEDLMGFDVFEQMTGLILSRSAIDDRTIAQFDSLTFDQVEILMNLSVAMTHQKEDPSFMDKICKIAVDAIPTLEFCSPGNNTIKPVLH
jgi:hypothetical protein